MKPIIEVKNISKMYRLGTIGYGSLSQDLQSYWAKLRGKEDPNRPLHSRTNQKGDFFALDDISFDVQPGERLGIIGTNGAGKSTLLKILSRVTLPTKGSATLHGRVASLLEVGTGFHPELTGRENIYLNGAILGMRHHEVKKKFDEIVDFSGIDEFIDTPVKRYSSGMYVRLAFAVAAHLEPEIMIIDEVLAVGDALFQQKCIGKMQNVARQEGRTILFVSHSMGTINSLCSRCIILKEGLKIFDGDPAEATALYFNTLFREESRVSFDPEPHMQAQILEVQLLDAANQATTRVDILKPFTVEMSYVIRKPLSGIVIGASLVTTTNEYLIATADHDIDRSKLGVRSPGVYKTRVTFPANLFNSGRFSVVVGISIPGRIIYDRRETLQFELVDTGSFMLNGGGEARRHSHLLLQLPWKESKLHAEHETAYL